MNPELKYTLKAIVLERAETRSERGEIVAALADQAGLTANHVRKIWNYPLDSANEARMEDIVAFAEVLGIPPVELLHPTLRTKIIDVPIG
jgi:hypothetical protein